MSATTTTTERETCYEAVMRLRFPADLPNGRDRAERHRKAWGRERWPDLITSLACYADAHERRHGARIGEDGYSGQEFEDLLRSCVRLLSADVGELDGGTCDGIARAVATAAGLDGDTL